MFFCCLKTLFFSVPLTLYPSPMHKMDSPESCIWCGISGSSN